MRHKAEMERNITIKLGYANAKIYKCASKTCARPLCYRSCGEGSDLDTTACENCQGAYELVRHVSFIDCPGHEILTRTMLSGASIMHAALLLISAAEPCPQPQTIEHLAALSATNLPPSSIIVVQNKVDLVGPKAAAKHAQSVREFLKGTVAEGASIIPISAQWGIGVDAVLERIARIAGVVRDVDLPARMVVVRSFDVNRPGFGIEQLKGGVAGGSIIQGTLRLHDEIEIRPGLMLHDEESETMKWKPLRTRVESLFAESKKLDYAVPGGLIGIGTKLVSELCRGDRLVGQIVGSPDNLLPVFSSLTIQCSLLKRIAGEEGEVEKLAKGEALLLNVGSSAATGSIDKIKGDLAVVGLAKLVCVDVGERIGLSRKVGKGWRLVGNGIVRGGVEAEREK